MNTDSLLSSRIHEDQALARLREVVSTAATALSTLSKRIDQRAVEAVRLMLECQGRVVVVGMGKAGLIGRKISATLCSTGTPSLFLHPVEAFHGDLGVVLPSDMILACSSSGETSEVVDLVSHVKRLEIRIVSLTGSTRS